MQAATRTRYTSNVTALTSNLISNEAQCYLQHHTSFCFRHITLLSSENRGDCLRYEQMLLGRGKCGLMQAMAQPVVLIRITPMMFKQAGAGM